MELIDKAALVAEIQKLYDKDYLYLPSNIYELKDDLLAIIDELEVKEVDLDKSLTGFMSRYAYENSGEYPSAIDIAKHFFELGIAESNKAQKGE